jgi:hypothetical protein
MEMVAAYMDIHSQEVCGVMLQEGDYIEFMYGSPLVLKRGVFMGLTSYGWIFFSDDKSGFVYVLNPAFILPASLCRLV